MKKSVLIAMFFVQVAVAQNVVPAFDTLDGKKNTEYHSEMGYFRKAHQDIGDPRFMFTESRGKFALGIGGTLHFNAYYDFNGAVDGFSFAPSAISVPTDYTNNMGFTVTGTEMHLKARSYVGSHKFVAYMRLSGSQVGDKDEIRLSQAYISIDGFTIGKTYSFFMDLEAGPATVDLQGPNTQISNVHTLVGYTRDFGGKWRFGVSAEAPHSIGSSFKDEGIQPDYLDLPDLAGYVKLSGNHGHVQLGAICRRISYWTRVLNLGVPPESGTKGENHHAYGYGVSLSGNWRPVPELTFSTQTVYGKGISRYIQDLSDLDINLGGIYDEQIGQWQLETVPAYGGYVSCSYDWSEKVQTSLVYGYTHLYKKDGILVADDFKSSHYIAANAFYKFTPYCLCGIEYLYGQKLIYADTGVRYGHANRIDATFIYRF